MLDINDSNELYADEWHTHIYTLIELMLNLNFNFKLNLKV